MPFHLMIAILACTSGLLQNPAGAQSGNVPAKPYVERSQKEFSFYPGGNLTISAAATGNVKIVGWEKSAVRVEYEKIFFYLPAEEAKVVSGDFPVRITNTPTSARVSTTAPPLSGAAMEVNLQVYVPAQKTDLAIRIIKGDLSVTGVNGSIEATLEEGNLSAKDLAGYFSAITKRGDLQVDLSGERWMGYGFTAGTQIGNVTLQLPAEYSATLQLETKDGDISVDYPPQEISGESVELQVMAKKNARSVNAPIGLGGTAIKLMTALGKINLKKK